MCNTCSDILFTTNMEKKVENYENRFCFRQKQ